MLASIPEAYEIMQYSTAFLLLFMAVVLVAMLLGLSRLIRPHKPSYEKELTYECGEDPVGSGWLRFNIRFYVVALVFVLFDVELALVYPVACIFKDFMAANDSPALAVLMVVQLMFFFDVLGLGLVYILKKGDLDWIRSFRMPTERGLRSWDKISAAPIAPSEKAS